MTVPHYTVYAPIPIRICTCTYYFMVKYIRLCIVCVVVYSSFRRFISFRILNLHLIANFKSSINKVNLITQFDLNPLGDPNVNYNILATEAKQKHIPRKVKRFNKRKHFKHKWMTNDLLTLINKKNDRYRDWKSTTDNILYEIKKINFKTFEKIVNNEITAAKSLYYFNTFTAQKMI